MSLVSGIYRLTASDTYPDKDETRRRIRVGLMRIVMNVGKDETERRIRAWQSRNGDEEAHKVRLLLEIDSVRVGQRAGS